MLECAVNLMGNICETAIILFFLRGIERININKKAFVLSCVILTMLQFANTSIFLSKSPIVIIGSLLYALCFFVLHKVKWYFKILYALFIYVIFALSEIMVGMILAATFSIDISFMQDNVLLFAICTLTSKFLSYVFILFTKRKWFKADLNSLRQNLILVLFLPISTFLILVVLLRCCYQINETSFHITVLIVSLILVFANIAVFYIVDKQNVLIQTKEKLLFAEKHISNQLIHYQELYKYQNELRIFRHDIRNRLEVLIRLIKNSQLDKAMDIMQANLDWLEESNNNIVNSGNPIIDAILQSKLHNAKEMGIVLNISTKLAGEIKIDEMELAIVLGNALDNAIEAVENMHNPIEKWIEFSLMTTDDRISILVSNPVESDVDTENLFTTKKNKEKHGYGIKSIKAVAERYDGMVLFACENKVFSVNINIANFEN